MQIIQITLCLITNNCICNEYKVFRFHWSNYQLHSDKSFWYVIILSSALEYKIKITSVCVIVSRRRRVQAVRCADCTPNCIYNEKVFVFH